MVGKLRCKSACSNLDILLQPAHLPQESVSVLFSQNIYCANASANGSPPVPSVPVIINACGNVLCDHICNTPAFATCWPTTLLKSNENNTKREKKSTCNWSKATQEQRTEQTTVAVCFDCNVGVGNNNTGFILAQSIPTFAPWFTKLSVWCQAAR